MPSFIHLIISLCLLFFVVKTYRNQSDCVSNSFVKRTVIPFYDILEYRYGAKYSVVIDEILYHFSDISNFNPCYVPNKSCFFVSDSNFIIISLLDKNSLVKIPFSSILYHNSFINGSSYEDHYYRIGLTFLYNGDKVTFAFTTLKYNHKLDKKYGNRLTGEELFLFIKNNFIDEEEYEKTHGYECLD